VFMGGLERSESLNPAKKPGEKQSRVSRVAFRHGRGTITDWIAALAGVNPQNPTQPASPPQDGELRGFYRDEPLQPWTLQRRR